MQLDQHHVLLAVDESALSSFDWARARRDASARGDLLSLVACRGASAVVVVPVQPAVDTPGSIKASGSGAANAGVGAAVAQRVFEAELAVGRIGHTEVRVFGGDMLALAIWEALQNTGDVSLARYDACGGGLSALVPPRKSSVQTAARIPLPTPAPQQPAGAANALAQHHEEETRRRALTERMNHLEARWKFTSVLWILFWVGVVIFVDSTIINAFADPYASNPDDPATRVGYNFISCVGANLGLLIPALICRAVIHSLRARTRERLRKQL